MAPRWGKLGVDRVVAGLRRGPTQGGRRGKEERRRADWLLVRLPQHGRERRGSGGVRLVVWTQGQGGLASRLGYDGREGEARWPVVDGQAVQRPGLAKKGKGDGG